MATMTLDDLVTQLRKAYGAHLSAVVLYGSAAGGEHVKQSDYNVLVLLDAIDRRSLLAASAVAVAWREAGNPPPMTMTVDEWRRSSDVFPMEYGDILDRHRVLYGQPPFEGVTVSQSHLRLQLEQQVMGKLLALRQATLLAGADGKQQLELISASLGTMLVLFRSVLRMHGEQPPADNAALAERVASLAAFHAGPFTRAVRHVRGESKLQSADAASVLDGFLAGIERLDAYLDEYSAPA